MVRSGDEEHTGDGRPCSGVNDGCDSLEGPPRERPAWRSVGATGALYAGPLLLIGVLSWPMLFTGSYFVEDWLNHLWFMWHQSLTIKANHLPSLFLNYSGRVYYPQYAFYGGTLNALVGSLSLLLGDAPMETYVSTYLLGFAAAYGGWLWISRTLGLRGPQAHVPGLLFITSAYYLTLIYARGDWPEFLGVSTIPLMVAATLAIVRAERTRIGPAIALAGSSVVFFGSHSLTIVWGSTVLVVTGLVLLACVPRARRALSLRRLSRIAGLVIPAGLVSAWFLLPTAAYQSRTLIGRDYPTWRISVRQTIGLVSLEHLFTLSRSPASTSKDFVLALPILAIAWVLVAVGVLLARGQRGTWTRVLLLLCGLTATIAVVMTHAGLTLALPRPYATLQFTYRLESYVLLGLSGAVLAVLLAVRGNALHARLLRWTLVPIVGFSLFGALQQVDAYPRLPGREAVFDYLRFPTAGGLLFPDYMDVLQPQLTGGFMQRPAVTFPPLAIRHDRVSAVAHVSPGEEFRTNVAGGPELVHVTGARIAGIEREGNDVFEAAGSSPDETITVGPAHTMPVVIGRVLTLGAGLVLVLELALIAHGGFATSRRAGRRSRKRGSAA